MGKYVVLGVVLFLLFAAVALSNRLVLESEWGYYSMTPTNLTTQKDLHIFPSSPNSDDLDYSYGSNPAWVSKVSENGSPYQATWEFWVKPNFSSSYAGTNYVFDAGYAKLYWDGANTRWAATVNGVNITKSDTFSAFDTVHVVLAYETQGTDTLDLVADGSSASQVTTTQTVGSLATVYVGQDSTNAGVFNGRIKGRALRRRITSGKFINLYSSGAGSLDFTNTDPDVFWADNYTDSVTTCRYNHFGKAVTAIADGATEDTLTTAAGSDTSLADNDEVTTYDGTGYSIGAKECVDGTPSSTSVAVDDGAGADAGAVEDVGVALDFNGSSEGVTISAPDLSTFTMAIWLSEDGSDTYGSIYGENSTNIISYYSPTSKITYYYSGANHYSNTVLTAKPHHVVVVNNAGAVTFYLDGAADGTAAAAPAMEGNFVGRSNTGNEYFGGEMYDIVVAKIALTAGDILWLATHPGASIADIYTNTSATETGGADNDDIVLYHRYRDQSLTDLSEYGNDGTHSGTPTYVTNGFVSKNLAVDGSMENANIGAWVQGDAATTHAKDSTVAVYDAYSLKIRNGDASQAYVRQTVTTTANSDYLFRGYAYGPATVNGASQLVDVDATAALGITATKAGLTATTWGEVTFCFQAADASTTIDLGTGSVTNTEVAYWDQVKLRQNLVAQGGCEAADGNALPTGWSDTGSPDADETQTDSADRHAGATSILLSGAEENEGVTQTITVESGKYYTLAFFEKNNAQDIDVTLATAATATIDATGDNTWTKHSYTFLASGTSLVLSVVSGAASQSGWFDDFSLVKCDTRAASTATKGTGIYPRTNPQVFE